jgi:hypothetical protein
MAGACAIARAVAAVYLASGCAGCDRDSRPAPGTYQCAELSRPRSRVLNFPGNAGICPSRYLVLEGATGRPPDGRATPGLRRLRHVATVLSPPPLPVAAGAVAGLREGAPT